MQTEQYLSLQVMPQPFVVLLTDYITAYQKNHCSLVLQEHPNSGTFPTNILQGIIHFYVIIHFKKIEKHDRN